MRTSCEQQASSAARWVWRIAAAFAAVLACACSKQDTIDEDGIVRGIRTLESISAESAFVCDEWRAGHLKATFAATHFNDLLRDALETRTELAKPSDTLLEAQHVRARQLADQLVARLQPMVSGHAAPDKLAEQHQAMLRLKDEFDSLERAL